MKLIEDCIYSMKSIKFKQICAYLLIEYVIASVLVRIMVTEMSLMTVDVWRGSLMALKMRRPISVRREHPAKPMIPDVSTATGANSKFASNFGYFRLFMSLATLDAEPAFKMVVCRLLAENKSVQMASQANALPPLKGKDVTQSGLLSAPRSRPTGSRIE